MPTLGLALGGGAARGIAHIGILQAFEEAGIAIDVLAGTSAGSLVGALYAAGVSTPDIAELALQLKWTRLVTFRPTFRSFMSGHSILNILEKSCPVQCFEDLRLPLSVVATDFETGERIVFTRGELFPPVLASCSIPLIFPPVKINGRYCIDGGFTPSIIPVDAVRERNADCIVACDVNYNAHRIRTPGNFVTTLIHLIFLLARSHTIISKAQAAFEINVNVEDIGLTEVHKAAELIRRGYQAASNVIPQLREHLLNKSFSGL